MAFQCAQAAPLQSPDPASPNISEATRRAALSVTRDGIAHFGAIERADKVRFIGRRRAELLHSVLDMTSSALQSEVALYNTGKHFIPDELRGFIGDALLGEFSRSHRSRLYDRPVARTSRDLREMPFPNSEAWWCACHVATIYRGHRLDFDLIHRKPPSRN